MNRRQPRTMSGPDLVKPRHTERELTSGKVPLRPIVRAGYLVLGAMFLGCTCVVAAEAISSVVHESWWIKCLVGAAILGWVFTLFAYARRLLWAALTAPARRDEDEDVESAASNQRDSN